jgi:hypothetical protein
MYRFYKMTIDKRPIGSAIEHREPPLRGTVITKVTDITTAGDYKLAVVDADDTQHRHNEALPGVDVLEEDEAVKLAPQYQPATTEERPNPMDHTLQKVQRPAVDLEALMRRHRGSDTTGTGET